MTASAHVSGLMVHASHARLIASAGNHLSHHDDDSDISDT
jgi:hypothetical protein